MLSVAIFKIGVYVFNSALHLALIGTMLKRQLARVYPAFFSYILLHLLRNIFLYWLNYLRTLQRVSYATYFYAYWTLEPVSMALAFVIIYTVFAQTFGPFTTLRRIGEALFWAGAAASLAFAILTTLLSPANEAERIVAAILLLDRSVAVMQAGLLLALFLGTAYLGLSWRSQTLGIALGFGVWACVDLVVMSMRTHLGYVATSTVSYVRSGAYALALMIWLFYMLAPQRAPSDARLPDADLQSWNEAVTELLSR